MAMMSEGERRMSHEIRADYGKQWLLPPSLEDWIGVDHPARFIREVVDALDLAEMGFRQRKSDEGRPSYAADLLLKVWLYGYFEKIRSSRGLERACMNNVGIVWLTGMHYPDKNTLWRFWKDNRAVVKRVYQSVLEMAMEAQLIGLVLHAVDGTKILSKISGKRALHAGQLKKILDRIEESVAEVMEETERAEQDDEGEYRLPAGLQDRERLRKEVEAKLEQLKQQGRQHWLGQDPEARFMKIGTSLQFGYNGQVVVDAHSGLIVAEAVVDEGK
jgi:transposase